MLNKEAFLVSVGEGRWYYGVVFHVVLVPPEPIMTVKLFRIKEANKESGEKEYLELKYSKGSTMLVSDISKLPPDGEYRIDYEGSGDNDGVLTVEGEKVSFNLDTYPNSGVAVTVDALVARGGVVSLLNQLTQALSRGLAYAEERIAVKRRGRICRAVRRGRDCQGGLRVRRGSWGEAVHRRETCRNIYSGSSSCWSAIQTDSEHSENSSLHLRLRFRRPVGNYGKVGERKCDNKRVLRRSRNIETAILLGVPSGLGLASNAASFAEVA